MNIRFPTENTVCTFYKNFNYGQLWSIQMQDALYIDHHSSARAMNTVPTVALMRGIISTKFSSTWTILLRRKNAKDFNNNTVSISSLISDTLSYQTEWIQQFAPKILIDFRTPIFGEPTDNIYLTENEETEDEHDENSDSDQELTV